jgi:hypothetical protein
LDIPKIQQVTTLYNKAGYNKENNIKTNQTMMTNSIRFWKIKKEKLLKKYENLTDKDLSFDEGKEKEMIEVLGNKLGKTRQELLAIIITL